MVQPQLERQEIFNVLQELVFDQGGQVTLREFVEQTGIAESQIRKHFGSWMALRREHGWTGEERNYKRYTDEELWEGYHELVERFGRFPTNAEVNRLSPFSIATYYSRFGSQAQVKAGYRRWLHTRSARSDTEHPGCSEQPGCFSGNGPESASGGRQSPDGGGSPATSLTQSAVHHPPMSSDAFEPSSRTSPDSCLPHPQPLSPKRRGAQGNTSTDPLGRPDGASGPAASADVKWLRDRWQRLRVAFELRSSEFRGRAAHQWDLLVVLEHDWPACGVKVLRLCDLLPETDGVRPDSVDAASLDPTRAELYGRMPWEND